MKFSYSSLLLNFLMSFILVFSSNNLFAQRDYGDDGILFGKPSVVNEKYELEGRTWDRNILTYYFVNGTPDISLDAEQGAIKSAFNTWEDAVHLKFIEVCNAQDADIRISWEQGPHGDGSRFDGTDSVLAHAFFPPPNNDELAGDMHFDEDEHWTLNTRNNEQQPIDLQTVALHEIGHSLGLRHTIGHDDAVMFSQYVGSRRSLTGDDINGGRAIYGAPQEFIQGPECLALGQVKLYTLPELPAGVSLSSLTISSNLHIVWYYNNLAYVIRNGTGTGRITATYSSGCSTTIFEREIIDSITGEYAGQSGTFPLYTVNFINSGAYTVNVDFPEHTGFTWVRTQGTAPFFVQGDGRTMDFWLPSGSVTFEVSSYSPCAGNATKTVTFVASSWALAVSPNPVNDFLTLNFKSGIKPGDEKLGNNEAQLSVVDKLGKVVLQTTIYNTLDNLKLDLSDLPPDIYFIKVQDGENTVTQKILKQ